MIGFTVVNRFKPRTVLLVHGLFASSGYWLAYLQKLKEYRLIILNIDYRSIRDVDPYLSRIAGIIEAEAGGTVDAIISHSLGCLLASRLPEHARRASFQVCPVHCATRLKPDEFVEDIEGKINSRMSKAEIRALLMEVDCAIAKYHARTQAPRLERTYLPNADPFFSYHAGSGSHRFDGDHFDIAEAVADIGSVLAS